MAAQIAAVRAWSAHHLPHDGALLWFAEPGIPLPDAIRRSGLGLTGSDVLAAAAGAAVAWGAHPAWNECLGADRKGALALPTFRPARVVVLLFRKTLCTSSGLSALALVRGLAAVVDILIVDGSDDDGERLSRLGVKAIGTAWAPCDGASVCWPGSAAAFDQHQHSSPAMVRQEWPPVHLASLPPGLAAPAMDRGVTPIQAIDAWLMRIAADEPRLILPHHHGWWPQQPADGTTLQALAQLACTGWRVVWRLAAGCALSDWSHALDDVGASGSPVKLLVPAADLPEVSWWMERRGWWCVAPADVDEAAAVILWALAHEDSVVIGLPASAAYGLATWPAGTAWMPGTGRWILGGPDDPYRAGTLVCRADRVARALTYHRPDESIFCCTSIWPLPVEDLRRAARRGPLRVAARLHSAVVSVLADEPEIRIERWGA